MKDKSVLKHIGSILFFILITVIFFIPQFQGKELRQGDQIKWHGMAKETVDYHESTGEKVAWCGSMFSGMPGYTVSIKHNYVNALTFIEAPFNALNHNTGAIILLALICGYVLFVTLGCPTPIAIFGAVAFAFSSYYPIIIEAGHVTKGWVMATMPIVIASMLLVMKRKYLLGGTFFAFALTENIRHGHIQITFYLLILCLFIFIGYLIGKLKEKKSMEVLKSTGVLLAGAMVALLLNSAQLHANYEMSKTSIRGKSELTAQVDGKQDKSSGLDQDYAFSWSYGKAETLTFLIPNFNGGASGGELDKNSALAKAYKKNNIQMPKSIRTYTYWGDQPFTSGPVYFGAIVCFLFVLSLLIVDKKYKWWVVAGTAFLIVMSWGKNCSLINDFLFHNLPFYNKFRTPSMALIIPQFTFVWFAALALKEIYMGNVEEKRLSKSLYIAAGITGGICLIFALIPSAFLSFTSPMDDQYQLPGWYYTALLEDRKSLLTADAWRSFGLILLAFLILFALTKIKNLDKKYVTVGMAIIAAVSFLDLWTVDRRYLNESNFEKKSKKEFVQTEADKFILQDKDPSYRVLTFNNPFNDTDVSYFHKSIGGYNAAKLRRYQDLIETHISQEMGVIQSNLSKGVRTIADADSAISTAQTPVLDMLNMRYVILQKDLPAATNHNANGNAWFVDEIQYVKNADEEISQLSKIDTKKSAIVDQSFAEIAGNALPSDASDKISMTSYDPMNVSYQSDCASERVAIFSEVYYQPGWNAYIDGKKSEHFRANWILRGLRVPAGSHTIDFKFEPTTYWNLTLMGAIDSFLLVLGIIAAIFYTKKKGGLQSREIGLANDSKSVVTSDID